MFQYKPKQYEYWANDKAEMKLKNCNIINLCYFLLEKWELSHNVKLVYL